MMNSVVLKRLLQALVIRTRDHHLLRFVKYFELLLHIFLRTTYF
jgi:hypothetical protein